MAASTLFADRPCLEVEQQHQPGGALDERAHRAASTRAQDEVAFPVARHGTVVDLGGPLGDHDHPRDTAPPLGGAALAALGAARTQASGQFTAQLAAALDVERLVDRLVTHPHLRIVGEVQR
jgi:hypothetical protein